MTDIKVGDRVTGRCVTLGRYYTGTVAAVHQPIRYSGDSQPRYKLVDTGKHYTGGRPIEPIVECASRVAG